MFEQTVTQAAPSRAVTWQTVYRVGGVVALIAVVLFRRNLGAEVSLFTGQVPPTTVEDWFSLLQSNALLGLTFLNVFDIVNYTLLGVLFLVVFTVLHQTHRRGMTIALWLTALGIAIYTYFNPAFRMLSLSNTYAAATNETAQTLALVNGEVQLTASHVMDVGLLLVTLAGLVISVVMLRGAVFSRLTAWLGLIGNGVILFYFVALFAAPSLTFLPHTLGAIPLVLWELLIGLRLFRLARETADGPVERPA